MVRVDQPSGQTQAVGRRILRERRQRRRDSRLHLFSPVAVVTPIQEHRVPRLFHLLHHHDGGNGRLQLLLVPAKHLLFPVQFAIEVGSASFQVKPEQILLLLFGPILFRFPQDGPDGMVDGQLLHFVRRQGPIIDAHLVHLAVEHPLGVAPSQQQRPFGPDGAGQAVVHDLHFLKLAVQVESHAGGSSGTVVGESQVVPLVQGHRGTRADLDGVVRPGMNQWCAMSRGPLYLGPSCSLKSPTKRS